MRNFLFVGARANRKWCELQPKR